MPVFSTKHLAVPGNPVETLLPTMRRVAEEEHVMEWMAPPPLYELLQTLLPAAPAAPVIETHRSDVPVGHLVYTVLHEVASSEQGKRRA